MTIRVEHMWGTAIGVDVRQEVAPSCLDSVFDWFRRVDDLFSTWRDDTEISRIARGDLRLADASEEVRVVLALCAQVTEESRGAFDVTAAADPRVERRAGMADVDPSGLVKGWALEQAASMLQAQGVTCFSINAGGDVLTRGEPEPGARWRVGIQHPWDRQSLATVVHTRDCAIATSGRYERGEHIIDPRTSRPPAGLMAVTVIGSDLALADGYATAAVVLGDAGMEWLAEVPDVEGFGITDTRNVVTTRGFDRYRERAACA